MKRNTLYFRSPYFLTFLSACFSFTPALTFASEADAEQQATLTQLTGQVSVLKFPHDKVAGEGVHVLFKGKYFLYTLAKVGDQVGLGEVVQTKEHSKARLIFENGDQFNVGEMSSFVLARPTKKENPKGPTLDLAFGRIRAIIDKEGPRNRLKIKTHAVTMGVRGTDFMVSDVGFTSGGAELQVFRGKVELKAPTSSKNTASSTSLITRGEAASVTLTENAKQSAPKIVEKKLTQDDLEEAHQKLFVETATLSNSNEVTQIKALEAKAVESSLKDLKAENPEIFKKLDPSKIHSAQVVNAEVLASLFDGAKRRNPEDKTPLRKPSGEEVERQIDEAYQNKLRRN